MQCSPKPYTHFGEKSFHIQRNRMFLSNGRVLALFCNQILSLNGNADSKHCCKGSVSCRRLKEGS